jgi:hypothetical protein
VIDHVANSGQVCLIYDTKSSSTPQVSCRCSLHISLATLQLNKQGETHTNQPTHQHTPTNSESLKHTQEEVSLPPSPPPPPPPSSPPHPTPPHQPFSPPNQVWFQDLSCNWHFVAPTFTHYFRLMIMHLGVPGWHYAFTDVGMDPSTQV